MYYENPINLETIREATNRIKIYTSVAALIFCLIDDKDLGKVALKWYDKFDQLEQALRVFNYQ